MADDDVELALFFFDFGDELAEFGGAADVGVAPGIVEGDVAPEVDGVDLGGAFVVEGFVAAAGGLEGTAMVFVGLVAHEGDFWGGEVGVGGGKEEEKKTGDDGGGFGERRGEEAQSEFAEFVEADAGKDGEGEGFEEEVPGDPFGMDEPAEAGGADGP